MQKKKKIPIGREALNQPEVRANTAREASHLLLWAVNRPPVVVLDLLQLVKLHGDVVDGELQQIPEPGQVLRGGPRHGAGVLHEVRVGGVITGSDNNHAINS